MVSLQTPPREFLIFRKGWNQTEKQEGAFLFDDAAASSVMENYNRHGVDKMIDLEHFSIDKDAKNYDPDARGYCKLELRNGELWAVDVRWTPDGERRVASMTQKYISPFFTYGEKTKRIHSLYNIAICAIPAIDDMPALVAASRVAGIKLGALSIEVKMDALKKIAQKLGLKEDADLEECLAAIDAYQADEKEEKKPAEESDDSKEEKKEEKKEESDEPKEDKEEPKDEKAALAALPPKLRGEFMALRQNNQLLSKRLDKIDKKMAQTEVDEIISENIDKIPLSLEPWARKQDPEVLRSFVKVAASLPRPKTPPKRDGGEEGEVALTKADKAIAASAGVPEEMVLKQKKVEAEKRKLRLAAQGE